MNRTRRLPGIAILAVLLTAPAASASRLPGVPVASLTSAPLAGIVTWKNVRIPGATVVIRGLSPGLEPLVWVLRTDKDGSFVWPGAPTGSYSVTAFAGLSKAPVHEVRHDGTSSAGVSFVSLELDKEPRIIPESAAPTESPWTARAVQSADPLRETKTQEGSPTAKPNDPLASPKKVTPLERLPVRATVASVAGRDLEAGSALSRTSIDVGGRIGSSYQWGLEGEYQSVSALKGSDQSGITRLALEIAPAGEKGATGIPISSPWNPQVRVETNRQALTQSADDLKYSEHRVDCLLPSGGGSSAGVSARLVSQENMFLHGPAPELFARQSDALEIQARYRTEVSEATYLRAAAAYRTDVSAVTYLAKPTAPVREARLLAGAGSSLNSWLDLEGTLTGDYSARERGLTPELVLKAALSNRLKLLVSVSQRFQSESDPFFFYAQTGTTEADLSRASRSLYRAGVLLSSKRGDTLVVEGIRREMASTLQYLLDRNLVEAVDALYLFNGDVVQELSASGTVRIGDAVHVRLAIRGGRIAGHPLAEILENDARYEMGEANFKVVPSQTDIALRYRSVDQSLIRPADVFQNSLEAVEISLSQGLPVPILRQLGSQWRVLLAIEFAERQNQTALLHSRRVSGGLGLSF